jgi:phosphotransferase system enzyme I (PtsP)
VSVGSNDLFQFVMAVDRGNPRLANRFDPLSRPFLRVLRHIVAKADASGTPVSLCGELAGKPVSAMALAGIGFRSISMAPSSVGPVKQMLRSLDVGAFGRELLARVDTPAEGETLREFIEAYARANAVAL